MTAENLVERLRNEADLCANEGADDIALLLNEAADALGRPVGTIGGSLIPDDDEPTTSLEEAYAEGRKDEREQWEPLARKAVEIMDRFNKVVWDCASPWSTDFDEAADALRKLINPE